MDNLTHSLVGWTIGQAGLKRKTRKGLAALILGANMPDIDVFLGWVPWAPLATHRGFTHGLVGGVLLMPPLLAGLLWLLDRWQQKRGAEFKSGLAMHFGWLLALSYIGTLSHPLLDWQTAYAIQLFSPFDRRWYHADTLFIIDVWILLALALAIFRSRMREIRDNPQWRRPAIAGLAAVLFYIGGNGVITALARQAIVAGPPSARPDVIVASPPPAHFWQRQLLWRQDHMISRGSYDPLRSPAFLRSPAPPRPDGMLDPRARQMMAATPEIVRFMRWSILPETTYEDQFCGGSIGYDDARFTDELGRARFQVWAKLPPDEQDSC